MGESQTESSRQIPRIKKIKINFSGGFENYPRMSFVSRKDIYDLARNADIPVFYQTEIGVVNMEKELVGAHDVYFVFIEGIVCYWTSELRKRDEILKPATLGKVGPSFI